MRGRHRFEVMLIASCLTTLGRAQTVSNQSTHSSIIADLVADLRDDHIPGNAAAATGALAAIGTAAVPALENALDSDDRQQRQYAAHTLSRLPGYRLTPRAARVLVEGMRSDETPWNATDVIYSPALCQDCISPEAIAELERALDSDDHQQRQCAAFTLCRLDGHVPSDRMLEVLVEGLRHDELPRGPLNADPYETYTTAYNAALGFRTLLHHALQAEAPLLRALHGEDPQQRFLCAVLLVASGSRVAARTAIPLLIEHLADNHIAGDAVMSARAMYAYGSDVLPYLDGALPVDDAQQRNLIRMLELSLRQPDVVTSEICRELGMPDVSKAALNPVTGRTLDRSKLFWHGEVFRNEP